MMLLDDATHHVMRSHVRGDGYVFLAWPKNATLKDLDYCKEVVNLQLDTFRNFARRKTETQEAANAEYESWFVTDGEKHD